MRRATELPEAQKGEIGPATLNVPTGNWAADEVLAIACPWNHRVLLWFGYPDSSNAPADGVLGQSDFCGGLTNCGSDARRADTLNWCYGVTIADFRLVVAGSGNRRVLVRNGIPQQNGAPADLALGQRNMSTRDETAGKPARVDKGDNRRAPAAGDSLCWPYRVAACGPALAFVDSDNNRVLLREASS